MKLSELLWFGRVGWSEEVLGSNHAPALLVVFVRFNYFSSDRWTRMG
jgi:hypothetical protein